MSVVQLGARLAGTTLVAITPVCPILLAGWFDSGDRSRQSSVAGRKAETEPRSPLGYDSGRRRRRSLRERARCGRVSPASMSADRDTVVVVAAQVIDLLSRAPARQDRAGRVPFV